MSFQDAKYYVSETRQFVSYEEFMQSSLDWKTPFEKIEIGTGRKICEGENLAILSIGHIGNYVTKAIEILNNEKIFPGHFDMRFVKPLDTKLLDKILKKYKNIITVEDGCIMGGFGSAILEFMAYNNYKNNIVRLGIPDKIIEHGSQDELYTECNYDIDGIVKSSKKILKK